MSLIEEGDLMVAKLIVNAYMSLTMVEYFEKCECRREVSPSRDKLGSFCGH